MTSDIETGSQRISALRYLFPEMQLKKEGIYSKIRTKNEKLKQIEEQKKRAFRTRSRTLDLIRGGMKCKIISRRESAELSHVLVHY